MEWLRSVGSVKSQDFNAKEPYTRAYMRCMYELYVEISLGESLLRQSEESLLGQSLKTLSESLLTKSLA